MLLIKQSESTAAHRRAPVVLVDGTDGVTAETGVTLSAGDMKISQNGGAEANHAGSLVELAGGDYYYEFAADELATLGYITGRIIKAGVRTFRIAAQVVAFDPYAAANLGLTNLDGTVSSRASQTSVDTVDDLLDTEVAAIKTVVDAVKAKTDNLPADPADASDIATAFGTVNSALSTIAGYIDTEVGAIYTRIGAPAGASIAADIAAVSGGGGGGLDAAGVRAAIGLASANLDVQLAAIDTKTTNLPGDPADQSLIITATNSLAALIGTPAGASVAADVAAIQSDTNDMQTRLPAALVGGRIDASVGAMAADVMTAAAAETDLVTALQLGLATAASLAIVNTATVAIQAKTDNLPTDPADQSLIIDATNAIMTRLGTPAGASVAEDVAVVKAETASIQTDTNDLQTRLPAALVGGRIDANTGAISGSATAAGNLEAGVLALVPGTCAAGSTTTAIITNLTEATSDHYSGRVITFNDGVLAGQSTSISAYDGTTKTLTVVALTEAPADTDAFVIS